MASTLQEITCWVRNNPHDAIGLIKYMVDEFQIDELKEYIAYTEKEMFDIVMSKAKQTGNTFIKTLLQMTHDNSLASIFCHSTNELKNHENDIYYVLESQCFVAKTESEVIDCIVDTVDATYIADEIWQHRKDIFDTLYEDCELYDILYDECYVEPDQDYED